MNKKDFTKLFLEQAGFDTSPGSIKAYTKEWWVTPYSPIGLRLTLSGSSFLNTVLKLAHYTFDVKENYKDSLKLMLLMNKHLSSPFYFSSRLTAGPRTITFYGETDASMIGLMGGDLALYLENFAK